MSGCSYSEIRWRPTREFRRNARINQQGPYSTGLEEETYTSRNLYTPWIIRIRDEITPN